MAGDQRVAHFQVDGMPALEFTALGIDAPTSGQLLVGGTDIARLSGRALAKWRSRNIGFTQFIAPRGEVARVARARRKRG